jgi:hypothetical protein
MRRLLVLCVLVVPLAAARAQSGQGTDVVATATATATAAPTTSAAPADSTVHSVTGYGYSDHPSQPPPRTFAVRSGTRPAHHPTVPTATGPVATLPGFEMLGEGGSRVFVELTQTVQVEERHAHGTLTYVLKGAHVTVHNNQNPLVTVHFNTPVTRARLVPAGHDLLFVIDLRANVAPVWKMNPGKEGSAVLNIDFPKGSYVSASTQ